MEYRSRERLKCDGRCIPIEMGQEANEDEKAVFGIFESGQYRKKT
jgi:hypothetical protein